MFIWQIHPVLDGGHWSPKLQSLFHLLFLPLTGSDPILLLASYICYSTIGYGQPDKIAACTSTPSLQNIGRSILVQGVLFLTKIMHPLVCWYCISGVEKMQCPQIVCPCFSSISWSKIMCISSTYTVVIRNFFSSSRRMHISHWRIFRSLFTPSRCSLMCWGWPTVYCFATSSLLSWNVSLWCWNEQLSWLVLFQIALSLSLEWELLV